MGKKCSYYGVQDALRNRREPSRTPGSWAGAVVSTESKVIKCVSQERWLKTREVINWFTQFVDVEQVPNCTLENYDGDCPQGHMPFKRQSV